MNALVDVSDFFNLFSARGGGMGSPRPSPRRQDGGGGGSVLLKIPRGRAFQDGRGRGAGRVSAASWGILG